MSSSGFQPLRAKHQYRRSKCRRVRRDRSRRPVPRVAMPLAPKVSPGFDFPPYLYVNKHCDGRIPGQHLFTRPSF